MSQALFCIRTLIIRWFCFSRILVHRGRFAQRRLNATLRSLHLAGLRPASLARTIASRLEIAGVSSQVNDRMLTTSEIDSEPCTQVKR